MLKSKSFLCLDFGAGSLKIAEFEPNEAGGLRIKSYLVRSLGAEGSQEATRESTLRDACKEMLAEKSFGSRNSNICAPGFQVFSKFVKLPQVDNNTKVAQIIQYEAQQNVPFPLDEVVWDYQILGSAPSGELEVLLIAIKSDVVEGIFRTAEAVGLDLHLVDASTAAMANAFRFNYPDVEDCTMVLDIGAKTSNVLFFEKGRMYARSINIGANSITQDFATESKLTFPEAEKLKVDEGFVSLGGAYEEPDSPQQALISKIARQVMTRLHIQMNQTIQFYRGQQGGSPPQRLLLAGGGSLMPYTAQFFAEKFTIPVDYFNPLRNIQIDEAIDLEDMAKVANRLGEVVGLAIRNLAQCPVDLNLMPRSHLKRRAFDQKKPYFVATIFSLAMVVFAYGWYYDWVANAKHKAVDKLRERLEPLAAIDARLTAAKDELLATNGQKEQYRELLESRAYWVEVCRQLQSVFVQAGANPPKAADANITVPAEVWCEKLELYLVAAANTTPGADPNQPAPDATPIPPGQTPGPTPPGMPPMGAPGVPQVRSTAQDVTYLKLTCRALNMINYSVSANNEFAYSVQNLLVSNAFFGAGSALTGPIEVVDSAPPTYGFSLNVRLKKPIKLK